MEDLTDIKRYLDAQLSPEEQADFEARLQADPDFAETVAFHRQLYAALKSKEADRLKALLREAESDSVLTKPSKSASIALRLVWSAAAAILAGLCIWFLWPDEGKNTDQALFAQYFQPFENTYFIVSRNETPDRPEADAFQAYDARDYAVAAARFAALGQDRRSPETLFFQANALLYNGQAEAAKNLLTPLANMSQGWAFSEASQWYLALACVQLGQTEEARRWLQGIASDGAHFKRQDAGRLLREMGAGR